MQFVHAIKSRWAIIIALVVIPLDTWLSSHQYWYEWMDQLSYLSAALIAIYFYLSRERLKLDARIWSIPTVLMMAHIIAYSIYFPGEIVKLFAALLYIMAFNLFAYQTRITNHLIWIGLLLSLVSYNTLVAIRWGIPMQRLPKIDQYNALIPSILLLAIVVFFLVELIERYSMASSKVIRENYTMSTYRANLFNAMSHNIRTPLTNVASLLEIAELSNDGQLKVQRIKPSITQLVNTVQLMFRHSRMSGTKQSITLAELYSNLKGLFPEHFSYTYSNFDLEGKKSVNARLAFVLEQLIINSIQSGGEVSVKTHQRSHLTFIINDNGGGIRQSTFEKLGTPILTEEGRFGMGLFLSLFLLDDIGFHCHVASTPNVGTTLWITNNPNYKPETNHLFRTELFYVQLPQDLLPKVT